MTVVPGNDLFSEFRKFNSKLTLLSTDFKTREKEAKACAEAIKSINSVDFQGFGDPQIRGFISDLAEAKRKFEAQVKEGLYDRTFFCIFHYKAGIKKTFDKAFANLENIQKQAEASIKTARVANDQLQPWDNRSLPQRALRPQGLPASVVRNRSEPLPVPAQQKAVPPFPPGITRNWNAAQIAFAFKIDLDQAVKIQQIVRQTNFTPFEARDLLPILERHQIPLAEAAKVNSFALRLQINFEESAAIVDYIKKNRDQFKSEAIQNGKNIVKTTIDTKLARSLQFDASGKVWIFLNQVVEKQNDKLLGSGSFKRVTQALDFDTMVEVGRPVMKIFDKKTKKIAERDIDCLEHFGLNTPGVVETFSTAKYVGKDKINQRVVDKQSAIQFKYENDLHTEITTKKNTPLIKRLKFSVDIAEGLVAIHDAGYIHTDLKPENILLRTMDSKEKKAVINDFGLAWHKREKINEVRGSRGYIAPEYLDAGSTRDYSKISNKIDVWSLGRVFELLFPNKELQDLVASMKEPDPDKRVDAKTVLATLRLHLPKI